MSFTFTKDIGKPPQLPFKDILLDEKIGTNVVAIESAVVPTDEIWEVQQIFFYTEAIGKLQLKKKKKTINYIFEQKDAATWIAWGGKILLKEGQKIVGTTDVESNLVLNVFGVKRLSIESALASRKLRVDLILPKEVDIQEPRAVKDPPM